ncbi:porin [Desulfosarcina variabilis]|uniref:porin n=1 Tax=Desulfosarcina variabilis TaxID=2300 RepID=UPI003AFA2AEC
MVKKWMSSVFCVGAAAALVLMNTGISQAVEVKLSGQINRAVMWADDGNESEFFHVDNDNSSTRFRFKGSQEVTPSIEVGVVWENEFQSTPSNKVYIGQQDDGSDENLAQRKLEAYFDMPFGKISIGQGDGAANGTSEEDLSGTSVVMYCGVADTGGSLLFRDSNNQEIAKISATRDTFDGLSRNDRVRYDTPEFGGLSFSGSMTNGDAWEVAARFANEFGGLGEIAAAVGYVDTADREDPEYTQMGASLSWLHSSGFNITASYGTIDEDDADTDPVNYYGKIGYKFGMHAIAVEYGMTEDLDQKNDESSNYGVAYVISPWKGIEFYGTYRLYMLDGDGREMEDDEGNTIVDESGNAILTGDAEDISVVMIGTRVKF